MTTTFFFVTPPPKPSAVVQSRTPVRRLSALCCVPCLDFLWITSLNFVTSLTPESTTPTSTAQNESIIIIMFAVAPKSFSFVRSNNGVSGGSGVGSSRRYVVSNA